MLSGQHFYYRTIRRNVIAMGTLFKNIQLVRYSKDTYDEIDRLNVPLTYAGKENFISKLYGDPDLKKHIQILLPRMSFEMTNIEYDPSRKLSSFLNSFNKIDGNSVSRQYSGVPYNLEFELNIYVRNVEDGTQIVEQILPYFNPDYTLSMSFIDDMNITRDIPIILEDVKYDNSYQGAADTTVRVLIWTLRFKMKTYFFGPISTGKIIRQATANTYYYNDTPETIIEMNLDSGSAGFQIGETIYQGSNLPDATLSARVLAWDNTNSILHVTNMQGKLNTNANIFGTITKTTRGIVSTSPTSGLLQTLQVTPNPPTANLGDDFGFTEVFNESPDI